MNNVWKTYTCSNILLIKLQKKYKKLKKTYDHKTDVLSTARKLKILQKY